MVLFSQIEKVQQYNVLIGMNGAGLVNALYLPKTSVAVQLVPYKVSLPSFMVLYLVMQMNLNNILLNDEE